jgi:hypothetical protein
MREKCNTIPHFVTWIGNWNPSYPIFKQNKNGTRHFLRAFGRTHVSHFLHGVMGICFRSFHPTPAVRPGGRALFFLGGPCLSPSTKLRAGSASWTAIRKGVIVSAVSPGLVVWPSSAADTGEKARIV